MLSTYRIINHAFTTPYLGKNMVVLLQNNKEKRPYIYTYIYWSINLEVFNLQYQNLLGISNA